MYADVEDYSWTTTGNYKEADVRTSRRYALAAAALAAFQPRLVGAQQQVISDAQILELARRAGLGYYVSGKVDFFVLPAEGGEPPNIQSALLTFAHLFQQALANSLQNNVTSTLPSDMP